MRARLLSRPLRLHDVRDVEGHVRALLDARLEEWGARLDDERYEDALTFLLGQAWELSRGYRPTPRLSFSTYSRRLLKKRLVDWYRVTFVDARYVSRVTFVPFELPTDSEDDEAVSPLNGPRAAEIDKLHVFRDESEDVLTRAAVGW